jgi:hypothetical protein
VLQGNPQMFTKKALAIATMKNSLNSLQYKEFLKYSPATSQQFFCARSNFHERFLSFQVIANAMTL